MPSSYSLLYEAWLPARRKSGKREFVRPEQLVEWLDEDPVVAFDWRRPDFDAAAREFMIGLLSTACAQEASDENEWCAWWETPPSPEALKDRLAAFEAAFVLDGAGPRFMQDAAPLEGEDKSIGALLIEAPGDQTLKLNKDLFVKRDLVKTMGRRAATMALYTLQTYAPSGGAGHRTSLRGGGPFTTLLLPPIEKPSLWNLLWLNVFWDTEWPDPIKNMNKIFPWMTKTRTSENKGNTTPRDVHPAQCYWGMPRRIRLGFLSNTENLSCDITGETDEIRVDNYQTNPWGTNYEGWSRGHPFSPYYRLKQDAVEWLPLHPQLGRQSYRDWVGLVIGDTEVNDEALRSPAKVFIEGCRRLIDMNCLGWTRLLAAGYDMDNMKARGFVESEMPTLLTTNVVRESLEPLTRNMVMGAREASSLTARAVGRARSSKESSKDLPSTDKGDSAIARDSFWERTETAFYQKVEEFRSALEKAETEDDTRSALMTSREAWAEILRKTALQIFDEMTPLDNIEERLSEIKSGGPPQIIARRNLIFALRGYGGDGKRFFEALSLPLPEKSQPKKGAASKSAAKAPKKGKKSP
ncbi:CRISPR system Cascade subunit CasA [Azospirillaceae bacterium]